MIPGADVLASVSLLTVVGMGLLAGGMGTLVGFVHRTYMHQRVPFYAPVIVGLGAIGLWLNSSAALIAFVSHTSGEGAEPLVIQHIETNAVAAVVGGFAAYSGGRLGDVLAPNVHALVGAKTVDREVSKLVRTVGRFITVTIPEQIDDIDGYEPVNATTKETLAGAELVFSRGLTVAELRDRIATRLREDYGIGYVDVDVNAEGVVEHFAVGSRAAGIGPTLPPRRVAVGVKTNPAPKASPGDKVQLWELPASAEAVEEAESAAEGTPEEPEAGAIRNEAEDASFEREGLPGALAEHSERWYRPNSELYDFAVRTPVGDRRYVETAEGAAALLERYYGEDEIVEEPPTIGSSTPTEQESTSEPRRIATGELRATAGDVATLSIDVGRLDDVDQSTDYKLVTLPSARNPDREFAALLRSANETMDSVTVEPSGELSGLPAGALSPTVVAIRPVDGSIETLPHRDRVLDVGDVVYVVGRPDELRKLQAAASRTGDGAAIGAPSEDEPTSIMGSRFESLARFVGKYAP